MSTEPTERERSSKRKSSHRRRLSISLGFSKRDKAGADDPKSSSSPSLAEDATTTLPPSPAKPESETNTPHEEEDDDDEEDDRRREEDNLPSGVRRVPLLLIVRLIDLTGLPFQEEARYQITWRRGAKRENSGKTGKKASALGQAQFDETLRIFTVAKQVTATGAFLEKSIAFILKRESHTTRKSTTAGSLVYDMAPVLRKEVGAGRAAEPHVVTTTFTTSTHRELQLRFEVTALEDCSRDTPTRTRADRSSRSRSRSRSISHRFRRSFSLSRADQKTLEERIAASTIYEDDDDDDDEGNARGEGPGGDDLGQGREEEGERHEEMPFTSDDLSTLMIRAPRSHEGRPSRRPPPPPTETRAHTPGVIQVYCEEDQLSAQEIAERRLHIISLKDFTFTDTDSEWQTAQLQNEARAARARLWEAQMEAKNDEILAAEARLCRAQTKLVQHDHKILGQLQEAYQQLDQQAALLQADQAQLRQLQDDLEAAQQRAARFQQARAALELECQEWQDKAQQNHEALVRFAQEGLVPEGQESFFTASQVEHSDKMRGLLRQGDRTILSESESLRAALQAKEKEAQQAQQALHELSLERETLDALLVSARARFEEATQQARQQDEAHRAQIQAHETQQAQQAEALRTLQEAHAITQAALAQEKHDRLALAQENQEVAQHVKQLQAQVQEAHTLHQRAQDSLHAEQGARAALALELSALHTQHETLQRQLAEEQHKNEQSEKEKQRLRQELSLHVLAAESVQGDLHHAQDHQARLQQELHELRALYDAHTEEAHAQQSLLAQQASQLTDLESRHALAQEDARQATQRQQELTALVASLEAQARAHQSEQQQLTRQLSQEEKKAHLATQEAEQQRVHLDQREKQVAALQAELSAARQRDEDHQATRQRERQQAAQQQQAWQEQLAQQSEREKELGRELALLTSHQEDQSSETHQLALQLQRYREALAQERTHNEEHKARIALLEQQSDEQARHLARLRALVKELAQSPQPLATMQAAQYAEDAEMEHALQALALTYDESLQRNRQQAHLLHSASRSQEDALTSLWAQVDSQIDALQSALYPEGPPPSSREAEADWGEHDLDRSVEALQRKMGHLVSLVGLVAPPPSSSSSSSPSSPEEEGGKQDHKNNNKDNKDTKNNKERDERETFDALPEGGRVLSYAEVSQKLSHSRMDRLANQSVVAHVLNAPLHSHAGAHADKLHESLLAMPTAWWFQRQWERTVEALEWAVDHALYNLRGLLFYLSLATHILHRLQQQPPSTYRPHPLSQPIMQAGVQIWKPSSGSSTGSSTSTSSTGSSSSSSRWEMNEEEQLMGVIVQIFQRVQEHMQEHIDFTAKPAVFGQPVLRKSQYSLDTWSNPITMERLVLPLETLYQTSAPAGLFPVVCQQLFTVVYGHLSGVLFNELLGRAVLCTPDVAIQLKAALSFIYGLDPMPEGPYSEGVQRAQEKLRPLEDAANLILTIGHDTAFASFEEISSCFVHLNVAQIKHFVDMMDAHHKEWSVPARVRDMIDTKSASPRTQLGTLALYLPLRPSLS